MISPLHKHTSSKQNNNTKIHKIIVRQTKSKRDKQKHERPSLATCQRKGGKEGGKKGGKEGGKEGLLTRGRGRRGQLLPLITINTSFRFM